MTGPFDPPSATATSGFFDWHPTVVCPVCRGTVVVELADQHRCQKVVIL